MSQKSVENKIRELSLLCRQLEEDLVVNEKQRESLDDEAEDLQRRALVSDRIEDKKLHQDMQKSVVALQQESHRLKYKIHTLQKEIDALLDGYT